MFPICAGMVRGVSRFVLFLFLGILRAPTRNSPERVRDTIWTFPEKSGKHPGLEPPGLASLKFSLRKFLANGHLRQNSLAIANAMAWCTQIGTLILSISFKLNALQGKKGKLGNASSSSEKPDVYKIVCKKS